MVLVFWCACMRRSEDDETQVNRLIIHLETLTSDPKYVMAVVTHVDNYDTGGSVTQSVIEK